MSENRKPVIVWEICNGGTVEETFDDIVKAREYMLENGYYDAQVSATVCAGNDAENGEVYEEAEYYIKEADLPASWLEKGEDYIEEKMLNHGRKMLEILYGYGDEPCIFPRVED